MATFIDEDENTSQATEDDQFDTLDSETADSIEEQPEVSEEEEDEGGEAPSSSEEEEEEDDLITLLLKLN